MTRHLSIKKISEAADVSPWTVVGWIRKGWLPSVKIGGARRISEKDFQDFISCPDKQRATVPATPTPPSPGFDADDLVHDVLGVQLGERRR